MKNKSFLRASLAGLLLVVVVSSGIATGAHPFTDVPDGRFYSEAVDWAFNNGITTGTSATTFEPDSTVTRGENITFAKRYDDFVVQPALATLKDQVAALEGQVAALENMGMSSVQETGTADTIAVNSSTSVLIDELVIGGSGTVDVVLNAHVQIENAGSGQGRFEVTLRMTDCGGAILGFGAERTGISTSAFVHSTIPVTGFADDVAGGSTIALCAEKFAPVGARNSIVASDQHIRALERTLKACPSGPNSALKYDRRHSRSRYRPCTL
jgi:hypothetical protein